MATAHAQPMHAHHAVPHQDETRVPPSPTLTNPDLILPDQPRYSSSSPSKDSDSHSISSPTGSVGSKLGHRRNDSDTSTELGVATAVVMPMRLSVGPAATVARPNTLSTYHGYEHGAPLSDIGEEETDLEDLAIRKAARDRSRVLSVSKAEEVAEQADKLAPPLRHKKRLSNISASSGESDWEQQFDTSKLGSDRVAADIANARDAANSDDTSRRSSKEMEEELAVLNERAEKILANARNRLSHMEDNLSKARHSMVLSTSKSIPNMHEVGLGQQPAGGLYRSISQSAQSRRSRAFPVRPNSTIITHGRAGSDAIVASSANRLNKIPEARSASAMEYRKSWLGHVTPEKTQSNHSPSSSRSFNSPLRVLAEEVAQSPSTVATSPDLRGTSGHGSRRAFVAQPSTPKLSEDVPQGDRLEHSSTPTSLERSSSQASARSARELNEKMSEMKSRIAELKSKAQADSLRRRSLQSLRSASPFNSANVQNAGESQWYHSSPSQQERAGTSLGHAAGAGIGWRSVSQQSYRNRDSVVDDQLLQSQAQSLDPVTPVKPSQLDVNSTPVGALSARTDKNTPSLAKRGTDNEQDEVDFESAVIPSLHESTEQDQIPDEDEDDVFANEEEQIYLNEVLEESLQDLEPDVPAIPTGFIGDGSPGEAERHEDRLDAFDYENMFLHSAMGTYTGQDSDDESEMGSVETSRQEQPSPASSDSGEDQSQLPDDMEDEFDTDEEMEAEMSSAASLVHSTGPNDESSESTEVNKPKNQLQTPPKPWMKAGRSNSMDSTSSTATFQTATEGDMYRSEDEEDEGVPQEILNWGNAPPHLQSSPASQRNILPSSSPLGAAYNSEHSRQNSASDRLSVLQASPSRVRPNSGESLTLQTASSPALQPSPIFGQNVYTISNSPRNQQHSRSYSHASELSDIEEQVTPQALTFSDAAKSPSKSAHSHSLSNTSTIIAATNRQSPQRSIPQMPLPPTPPLQQSPSYKPSHSQPSIQNFSRPPSSRVSPAVVPSRVSPAISTQASTPASQASLYPANTEILMESLIKLADPHFSIGHNTHFEELDKELVLGLLRAVGGVCDGILRGQKLGGGGIRTVDVLRERLRAATHVLATGIENSAGNSDISGSDEMIGEGEEISQYNEDHGHNELYNTNDQRMQDEVGGKEEHSQYEYFKRQEVYREQERVRELELELERQRQRERELEEEIMTDEEDGVLGGGKRRSMLEGLGIVRVDGVRI